MPTSAQSFFASTIDHDGAWGTDIRKLAEAAGGVDGSTMGAFGTAAATIVMDPFTTRSTTGTADAPEFGWAINRLGADGMESSATAKRIIPAGTWDFFVQVSAAVATTNVHFEVRVYRVSSSGTRTLLIGPLNTNSTLPISSGTDLSASSSESQITLEADETLLVSFTMVKEGGTLLGETYNFNVNNGGSQVANGMVRVPSPGIRTQRFRSDEASLALTAARSKEYIPKSKTANLALVGAFSRQTAASREFVTNLSLTAAIQRAMAPMPKAVLLTLASSVSKTIAPTPKIATLTLSTALSKVMTLIPKIAALTLSATASRSIAASREFSAPITLTATSQRRADRIRAFTTNLSLSAVAARMVAAQRTFSTALSLNALVQREVQPIAKVATLNLSGSMSRQLIAARAFVANLALTTAFQRRFIKGMMRAVSLPLTARARVDISTDMLNRITSGGTTIIKKITNLFDD
jgi:hypothetical protein